MSQLLYQLLTLDGAFAYIHKLLITGEGNGELPFSIPAARTLPEILQIGKQRHTRPNISPQHVHSQQLLQYCVLGTASILRQMTNCPQACALLAESAALSAAKEQLASSFVQEPGNRTA